MQGSLADPGDPRDLRALQARLRASASGTRDVVRAAPRPAARCAATDPVVRAPAARRRRRRRARRPRRSCCASSPRRPRRRPAAAREPRPRPAAARRARAAARAAGRARAGTVLWSSEDPRYGGQRHAAARIADGQWRLPGRGGRRARARAPRTARGAVPMIDAVALRSRRTDRRRTARDAGPARSTREWLVTNGLGGYASRHRRRRADAPLPRPARRRAARRRSAAW